MQCPKCRSKMRQVSYGMSSAFNGAESEPGLIAGWSCEPAGCGHWVDAEVMPKPIERPAPEQIMQNGNYRSESQIAAKMRCEDYFEQFKHEFKNGLVIGRTFKAIWLDIKENNMDLPSRSWLRSRYLEWIREETAPVQNHALENKFVPGGR